MTTGVPRYLTTNYTALKHWIGSAIGIWTAANVGRGFPWISLICPNDRTPKRNSTSEITSWELHPQERWLLSQDRRLKLTPHQDKPKFVQTIIPTSIFLRAHSSSLNLIYSLQHRSKSPYPFSCTIKMAFKTEFLSHFRELLLIFLWVSPKYT